MARLTAVAAGGVFGRHLHTENEEVVVAGVLFLVEQFAAQQITGHTHAGDGIGAPGVTKGISIADTVLVGAMPHQLL